MYIMITIGMTLKKWREVIGKYLYSSTVKYSYKVIVFRVTKESFYYW